MLLRSKSTRDICTHMNTPARTRPHAHAHTYARTPARWHIAAGTYAYQSHQDTGARISMLECISITKISDARDRKRGEKQREQEGVGGKRERGVGGWEDGVRETGRACEPNYNNLSMETPTAA